MPNSPDSLRQIAKPTVFCQICGEEFVASGPNGRRCPECNKAFSRVRNYCRFRNQHRAGRNNGEAATADAIEAMREAVANGEKPLVEAALRIVKARSANHTAKDIGPHQCLYCGRPAYGAEHYCAKCVKEGLDNLHRVTGRTNGWDKPKPKPYRCLANRRRAS